jgi:hypothetical protein
MHKLLMTNKKSEVKEVALRLGRKALERCPAGARELCRPIVMAKPVERQVANVGRCVAVAVGDAKQGGLAIVRDQTALETPSEAPCPVSPNSWAASQ